MLHVFKLSSGLMLLGSVPVEMHCPPCSGDMVSRLLPSQVQPHQRTETGLFHITAKGRQPRGRISLSTSWSVMSLFTQQSEDPNSRVRKNAIQTFVGNCTQDVSSLFWTALQLSDQMGRRKMCCIHLYKTLNGQVLGCCRASPKGCPRCLRDKTLLPGQQRKV